MDVHAIDHVNLRIPETGIDDAVEFYGGLLGFATENRERYAAGDTSFFTFRVSEDSVIHVRPDADFEPPTDRNFDHLALRFGDPIDRIRETLVDAGIELVRELDPLGATGVAPAVYARDPFGYLLELKTTN